MSLTHLKALGDVVLVDDLKLPRAKQVCAYVLSGANPYVRLVEATRAEKNVTLETVVIDVKVDRPARVVNEILYEERISIVFDSEDRTHPEVWALRSDFPRVPHTNLRPFERPKSLCLYERSFDDVRHIWTPESFISRIGEWLSKSALGLLHDDDQALEPFLALDADKILVPPSIYSAKGMASTFFEISIRKAGSKETYVVSEITEEQAAKEKRYLPLVGVAFVTPPVTHGFINHTPQSFGALCELLRPSGFDLLLELRGQLKARQTSGNMTEALFHSRLVILLSIPHRRTDQEEPESSQPWAFAFHSDVRTLGAELGVWSIAPGQSKFPGILLEIDESKNAANELIKIMVPLSDLTPENAAKMTDAAVSDFKGIFIGVGALGGYISINLIKTGFGKWTVIDGDILLPHNSARHVLPSQLAGYAKSEALAHEANRQFPNEDRVSYLIEDILNPSRLSDLKAAMTDSELIIDCTASIPVARLIEREYRDACSRRASVFLSPSGNDLVILAESKDRKIRLDSLEMQYLRAVNQLDELTDHLLKDGERIRYARTCADVSSTISNDTVVLHSAIAARQIRRLKDSERAMITIWRADPENLSVNVVSVPVENTIVFKKDEWTVVTDTGLLAQLQKQRTSKLPSETGGSLVGSFDLTTKTIYVVDSLPTPSDSVEGRANFIRGEAGNLEALQNVHDRTSGQITYIGEWHSHPAGSSTRPSRDDIILFSALESRMHPAGLPAVMLIIGDDSMNLTYSTPEYCK